MKLPDRLRTTGSVSASGTPVLLAAVKILMVIVSRDFVTWLFLQEMCVMEMLSASVQYNDMIGEAAADQGDQHGFHAFAKEHGVDMDKYWPVAVSLYAGTDDFQSVSVYAVEKAIVGSNADEVSRYANAHGGTLQTKCFDTKATITDLLKSMKRFNVVLRWRYSAVKEIQFQREDE